jgi:D-alanyl-D-alanine endopeptidase (penicillin-binding protein 7)
MKKLLILSLLFLGFNCQASSYTLYNFSDAAVIESTQNTEIRSIASITKLFTAATILENHLDLNEKVKVQGNSKGRFPKGKMVTRLELMKAMLIASDNLAADSLAHSYPGGYKKFIEDVNLSVSEKNLKNTKIVDASGLLAGNVSTADDLADFLWSIRYHQLIIDISSSVIDTVRYDGKKQSINIFIKNTNPDISKYNNILISKTGFTNSAGRCLVMLVSYQGDIYALAILGGKNPKTRSKIVTELMNSIEIKHGKNTV